ELLEVQALLDQKDVAEAQRRLARLDNRPDLAHGVAFLTTRLLHLRGRLDHAGVAERLRDLVAQAPDFQEALALLSQSEASAKGGAGPEPAATERRSATPIAIPAQEGARPVVRTPQVPQGPPDDLLEMGPLPSPSRAPPAQPASPRRPTSRPSSRRRGNGPQRFTPVTGFEAKDPHGARVNPSAQNRIPSLPEIPRAPAIPQFRDNHSPPSYAPDRRNTEPDLFKGKSLLPRNAGRYSETPTSMDIIEPNRPRRGRGPRPPSIPASQRHRETMPHTPERIRSAAPPRASASIPTLFDIASWIDEGRFRDAVAAINRAGPNAGPEYAVLRARALAGAGYVDQALELLEQLDRNPSPDPELRAATARLFVELGDPGRALAIAKGAIDAEPDRPLVRLTYALAAVRACRRRRDPALLEEADQVLSKFAAQEGPLPALYLALRACILAGTGDANRAISTAQRALGLDAKSPDAFAAIAEAAAHLGRVHDARQAWSKLAELAPAEGEAMSGLLSDPGPENARSGSMPARKAPSLWSSIDVQLVAGRHGDVLRALERAAQDAIRKIAKAILREDFTAIATVGASFLTTSPVFSSFVPYDASLWSLRRLEAALDLILGRSSEVLRDHETGLVVLLGSYLGESLRLAHVGRWEGRSS
ncbi:MAG TPA: hypothetical protein VHF22_07055, partial [Planctomycetota bacterium]|nr:hypothetical protein [Planctomycetota bacterium]